jgi:hypothetical protein
LVYKRGRKTLRNVIFTSADKMLTVGLLIPISGNRSPLQNSLCEVKQSIFNAVKWNGKVATSILTNGTIRSILRTNKVL